MRVIVRNNKIKYMYAKTKMTEGIKLAIILFIIAVSMLALGVLISILFNGNAPTFVASFGIMSIGCNVASMVNIVLEVYLYQNFAPAVRNMLLLQIAFFIVWIFII